LDAIVTENNNNNTNAIVSESNNNSSDAIVTENTNNNTDAIVSENNNKNSDAVICESNNNSLGAMLTAFDIDTDPVTEGITELNKSDTALTNKPKKIVNKKSGADGSVNDSIALDAQLDAATLDNTNKKC
jgi:hypothetical protein